MHKLILDANMILVFVIGSVDPGLLGVAKRAKDYKPSDYSLIHGYLNIFQDIILLPNTVSEVSNLLGHLKGKRRQDCMERLAVLTRSESELYVPSASATEQPDYAADYAALGVTDAAILYALGKDTCLLTADWGLYLAAISRNQTAQYFKDLRDQSHDCGDFVR